VRKPPSISHWLGTDDIGRDELARMIWGAQASLLAGVVSVMITIVVSVPVGLVAGYFGGWVDQVISRTPMRCSQRHSSSSPSRWRRSSAPA
jgi:peptide/nickel transport system permease protein